MHKHVAILIAILITTTISPVTHACSRVLWDTKKANVVGRTMDWMEDTGTNIWVFPRGIERNGLVDKNHLTWTSRYGSVVSTIYDIATVDGMNEKGLVVNALFLAKADYGKRDDSLPGMSVSLWTQYYLDEFATVDEALRSTKANPYQLVSGPLGDSGYDATAHLAISDKSGDSAILEFIDGKLQIYHARKYRVMTNDPTFDKQLANMKQYKGFGGSKELPGSTEAADRFVRAAYYESMLPVPKTQREAVGGVWSVMRNVSQPLGTSDAEHPNHSATLWTTVSDMTDGVYYFGMSMSPTIFWVDLNKIDFKKGAPILKLDVVNNPDRLGDVTAEFVPSKSFEFMKP